LAFGVAVREAVAASNFPPVKVANEFDDLNSRLAREGASSLRLDRWERRSEDAARGPAAVAVESIWRKVPNRTRNMRGPFPHTSAPLVISDPAVRPPMSPRDDPKPWLARRATFGDPSFE